MRTTPAPKIVSYGGGINSTALLVGMIERGQRPDAILFADTGAEKPETYEYVLKFGAWLQAHNYPALQVVSNKSQFDGLLEAECLEKNTLPSIAFGHRRCSQKYKQRPMHNWARAWQPALDCWAADGQVVKLLGIAADERHRARIEEDRWYVYEYPLISWGWGRLECEQAIGAVDLSLPAKSACFFCPAMRKVEVVSLAEKHPRLFARAVEIERRAIATGEMHSVNGLGRHWSWEKIVTADRRQLRLFDDADDAKLDCMCANDAALGDDEDC